MNFLDYIILSRKVSAAIAFPSGKYGGEVRATLRHRPK
jgi:hypothetical protein